MDNSFNIKYLGKEYFVTLEGRPVCPAIIDEPGTFDNDVLPIYRSLKKTFDERVKLVSVTTFVEDEVNKDGDTNE